MVVVVVVTLVVMVFVMELVVVDCGSAGLHVMAVMVIMLL